MDYLITFLEGLITFISPCLLPMLPVYISYFAGQDSRENRKSPHECIGVCTWIYHNICFNGCAGRHGWLVFEKYQAYVNVVTGIIVIIFGLNFIGLVNIPLLNRTARINLKNNGDPGFIHSVLFGLVFSIGWTPCVGAFLGSALMLAAQSGERLKGS